MHDFNVSSNFVFDLIMTTLSDKNICISVKKESKKDAKLYIYDI